MKQAIDAKKVNSVVEQSNSLIFADSDQWSQLNSVWRQIGINPKVFTPDDPRANIVASISVPELLEENISVELLVDTWMKVMEGGLEVSVADLILIEFWFSAGAHAMADVLPKRFKYTKTLLTIRQHVGLALHNYAREVNWRKPVLFVSILKLGRAYLREAVGHEDALRPILRREFTGRLGVVTVLISRFEPVSLQDATEAVNVLRRSIYEQGNSGDEAFSYFLEAVTVLHDIEPSVELLENALGLCREKYDQDKFPAGVSLAQIDLLLRLAASNAFGPIQMNYIERAEELANRTFPQGPEDKARLAMATGILQWIQAKEITSWPSDLPQARLPFGIRNEDSGNSLLALSAPYILPHLKALTLTNEPLARGLLADLLSMARESLGMSEEKMLEEIVPLRAPSHNLSDERNRLLNARDRLRLAAVRGDAYLRINAVLDLVSMLGTEASNPTPLLLLAREVEEHGPRPVPIEPQTPEVIQQILHEVSSGDHEALFKKAAQAALADPNLTVSGLGGRSGVTTVGDYYGLSGETFVYKSMSYQAVERERKRAKALEKHLKSMHHSNEFHVPTILATYHPQNNSNLLTAVRRYTPGRSLHVELQYGTQSDKIRLLSQAARFLGEINNCEKDVAQNRGRREVKSKEMGRWLKSCGIDDINETFESWWNILSRAKLVSRRDAHLYNWLIQPDGSLVAIDLEAQGWRPAGYDLAQITDDHIYLEPTDWESRKAVFDEYRKARGEGADSELVEWEAFQAAVLSRAVWGLTDPWDGPFPPGAAEMRIRALSESADSPEIRRIGAHILAGWLGQRGLTGNPQENSNVLGAGRVRLSKAMAYHLRHDVALDIDAGGWATLEDLQQRLAPSVSIEDIATAATDKREKRFEISEGKIRAKYGHSRVVEMEYSAPTQSKRLYHASPWAYAQEIIDNAAGVLPMARQWVHLTDGMDEAVVNGMRSGHPLVYSARSDLLPGVLEAPGRMYLASEVPVDVLSVVPVSCYWSHIPPVA